MIYGYARVSRTARASRRRSALTDAGAKSVPRSGERSQDRPRAASPAIDALGPGDVLMVTRLDRLARSTRDLLNTLAAITGKQAGFRSLGDTWADTTTSHGRLMLTVLGGLAEFERDLIRTRTGEGRARAKARGVKMGRKPKLTPHQQREAITRRERGEETLPKSAAATTSAAGRFAGRPRSAGRAASRDFVHRWKRGRSRSAWIIDPILPARAEHGGLGRRRPPRQDRR